VVRCLTVINVHGGHNRYWHF